MTSSWANMTEEEMYEVESDCGSDIGCMGVLSTSTSFSSEGSENKCRCEIALTAAMESSLCRRGRRRLRELQANSSAKIRYDRRRSVLKVSGTEAEVAEVRSNLECVGGIRKVVPTAVWCELMRTRLEEDPERSALQQMQLKSGCRIHIERSLQEVRIFGSDERTKCAIQLLEEFEQQCIEESIAMADEQTLPEEVVESITDAFAVTVNVEKRQVVVYGIEKSVAAAAAQVEVFLKTGALSLVSGEETDIESEDGMSEASSGDATWSDVSIHSEPCSPATEQVAWSAAAPEDGEAGSKPQSPAMPYLQPMTYMQVQPVHALPANFGMASASPCLVPAMGQMQAQAAPMPVYQAVWVPSGMVLAPAPVQFTSAAR